MRWLGSGAARDPGRVMKSFRAGPACAARSLLGRGAGARPDQRQPTASAPTSSSSPATSSRAATPDRAVMRSPPNMSQPSSPALGLKPGGPGGSWFLGRAVCGGPAMRQPQRSASSRRQVAAARQCRCRAAAEHHRGAKGRSTPDWSSSATASSRRASASTNMPGSTSAARSSSCCAGRRPACRPRSPRTSISPRTEAAAAKGAIGIAELTYAGPTGLQSGARRFAAGARLGRCAGRRGKAGSIRAVLVFVADPQPAGRSRAPRDRSARPGSSADRPLRGFRFAGRLSIAATSALAGFPQPRSDRAAARRRSRGWRQEYVVLMAHLDHLGIKPVARARRGRDLQWRARQCGRRRDDDRGGARPSSCRASRRGARSCSSPIPARSPACSAPTISSRTRPCRSGRSSPAVNLDMPLLTYDFTDVIAFGADHSTDRPDRCRGRPRDGRRGVPGPDAAGATVRPLRSLPLRPARHSLGVPDDRLRQRRARGLGALPDLFYHQPSDDLTQAIRWAAGARFAELNYRIARALANADQRPLWYAHDYFGDSFAPAQPRAGH